MVDLRYIISFFDPDKTHYDFSKSKTIKNLGRPTCSSPAENRGPKKPTQKSLTPDLDNYVNGELLRSILTF